MAYVTLRDHPGRWVNSFWGDKHRNGEPSEDVTAKKQARGGSVSDGGLWAGE